LKQGDSPAPSLFNLVLEYIVRKCNLDTKNSIAHKQTKIMAYADDIIIVSRSLTAMKETYKEIKTIGLEVNVNKTKMLIQTRRNQRQTREINMEGDGIEIVEDFICLGSKFHKDGEDYHEITRRIKLVNKAYFSLSVFRSKDIHRANKIKIYKTLIRPVLYHGCGGWTLNKKEELAINSFNL
jgi:hypothetical protein